MSLKTIAAIATPLGEGSIGTIRISGDDAIKVADCFFNAFSEQALSSLSGYSAAYGLVSEADGEAIDDAVALVFRAPHSYTGEDTVEISVHGGRVVLKAVLRRALECGAQLAEGGEFTKRAFLNGKLDLAKAESVMGLISAKNEAALKLSRGARSGKISRETEYVTEKLLETAASLAVYSDYPDEEIEGLDFDGFRSLLEHASERLSALLSTFDAGKAVLEGVEAVIVGKPNVGKSTLMNLLCGSERSIVTDIAGTTRDIIENTVNIGDITLNLSDTAGIHETEDTVERFGVDRAREKIENAHIILAVFDASSELSVEDKSLLDDIRDKKTIVILNKSDLAPKLTEKDFCDFNTIQISAKTGEGYERLSAEIARLCDAAHLTGEETVLISERQRNCASRALEGVRAALDALVSGATLDAVGVCVDDAVAALLELTGKRVTNEVADEVFRRFCVGK